MDNTSHSIKKLEQLDHCPVSEVLSSLERAARTPDLFQVKLHRIFRKENWKAFQDIYGGDKNPFVDKKDHEVVDTAWADLLMQSAHEVDGVIAMLNALLQGANELRPQLESSQQQVIAAKLSKGIKSLPDEILARIFEITVWEQRDHREYLKQIVRLTRVSRRFRYVALGTRGLWTMLDAMHTSAQLKSLISRAGSNERFHATLYMDFENTNLEFIEDCRPIIPRLTTLAFNLKDSFWYAHLERNGGIDAALEEMFRQFIEDGSHFSILQCLEFIGERNKPRSGFLLPAASTIRNWAPSLRTLRCRHFLPSLFSPLFLISTLVIAHRVSPEDSSTVSPLKMLLDLLLKLPNLSYFELEANEAYEKIGAEVLLVTECPSITTFRLKNCDIPMLGFPTEGSCIAEFMNAVRMPCLENYSILIDIKYRVESDRRCIEWSRKLDTLTRALLPDHFSNSTRLTSLSYKLLRIDHWREETENSNSNAPETSVNGRELRIPLERIPHVRTLTLSSSIEVMFTLDDNEKSSMESTNAYDCRLQELRFVECENMTSAHLRRTVDSLESLGAWKKIERVDVQECQYLTHEDIEFETSFQ
ncbi:hypothetical protein SCHPADRAFT_1002683 [Schizopora paradoxa]|uniref:F-box domain-containing protein n=1 Tax=Schizopora paradoxa TaxID=27342 RepID=A0A0H2RLT8_9AGAM|nr:hypothetical protein SCHPADRAFT_1002683 [Schizopora paradoxa]